MSRDDILLWRMFEMAKITPMPKMIRILQWRNKQASSGSQYAATDHRDPVFPVIRLL
jgi:hypothetical protein